MLHCEPGCKLAKVICVLPEPLMLRLLEIEWVVLAANNIFCTPAPAFRLAAYSVSTKATELAPVLVIVRTLKAEFCPPVLTS